MNNARMIDLAQLDELARRLSSLVPPGLREDVGATGATFGLSPVERWMNSNFSGFEGP